MFRKTRASPPVSWLSSSGTLQIGNLDHITLELDFSRHHAHQMAPIHAKKKKIVGV
jgi:hypothetical protein